MYNEIIRIHTIIYIYIIIYTQYRQIITKSMMRFVGTLYQAHRKHWVETQDVWMRGRRFQSILAPATNKRKLCDNTYQLQGRIAMYQLHRNIMPSYLWIFFLNCQCTNYKLFSSLQWHIQQPNHRNDSEKKRLCLLVSKPIKTPWTSYNLPPTLVILVASTNSADENPWNSIKIPWNLH
jgi:hypothetical protein